jgi:hypothetical protein
MQKAEFFAFADRISHQEGGFRCAHSVMTCQGAP